MIVIRKYSRDLPDRCTAVCFMIKKITALQVQKRNPNRVNVHLDGTFAFGLSRIVAAWLQVGQELSEEKIAQLQQEDAGEVAYQRAVRYLSYRPRSVKEITDHLRKHEIPEEWIGATIERLQSNRLVDDRRFAEIWLENRATFRPRGTFALRMELRQKGVSDRVIDEALSELDEIPLALQAGRKKCARLRNADEEEFRKKMYGFLSRRGFSYETISEVLPELWRETKTG